MLFRSSRRTARNRTFGCEVLANGSEGAGLRAVDVQRDRTALGHVYRTLGANGGVAYGVYRLRRHIRPEDGATLYYSDRRIQEACRMLFQAGLINRSGRRSTGYAYSR